MTVREAFRAQSRACAALGSPFMARLMALSADRLTPQTPVGDRVLNWPGNPDTSADSVPLRLAGALHALRLEELALETVYPPHEASDDALWAAIEEAFHKHERRLLDWLTLAPQTNEIRRSGVLLAAFAEVGARYPGQSVELLELGASAGLNLAFDRYRLDLPGLSLGPAEAKVALAPDWSGPLPPETLPRVIARAGADLNPLDPEKPQDRLRLLAYLWPDQPARQRLTRAALVEARHTPRDIARADAGDWLARRLAIPAPDRLRVMFHTVAWQYFPESTAQIALSALHAAPSPTVQIAMEADGEDKGAGVTLTHWPKGRTEKLGRADFHGRWIEWY